MKLLQKNKNIFIAAFALLFSFAFTGMAFADYAPGCYQNGQKVNCSTSPGTNDFNGSPMDASNNCYTLAQGPVPSGSGDSKWQQVSCSDLTSAPGFQKVSAPSSGPHCGGGSGYTPIYTTIDLGCTGKGNPIMDMLFAFIRILGAGVGIVVIASVILAGIQYSAAHNDPQAKAGAMKRIQSSTLALFIYIFAYAILNFVIPGGFFNG